MNERQFLNKINSKENISGKFTILIVHDLIDCEKKELAVQSNFKFIKKIIKIFNYKADIKNANIGRLKKPNKQYLNNEKVDVAPNSIGFDKNISKRGTSSRRTGVNRYRFCILRR